MHPVRYQQFTGNIDRQTVWHKDIHRGIQEYLRRDRNSYRQVLKWKYGQKKWTSGQTEIGRHMNRQVNEKIDKANGQKNRQRGTQQTDKNL